MNNPKKELKKTIPFTIVSTKNRILRNLTKEVKDLYTINYKIPRKEIKEDREKWKDIPCSLIRWLNIVQTSVQSSVIYRFYAIPIEIPIAFFTQQRK